MPWERRPDWLYLPHQFEEVVHAKEVAAVVSERHEMDKGAIEDGLKPGGVHRDGYGEDEGICGAAGASSTTLSDFGQFGRGEHREARAEAGAGRNADNSIRGRRHSPGATTTEGPRVALAGVQIRGLTREPGAAIAEGPRAADAGALAGAPGAAHGGGERSTRRSAQERLMARNSHLQISLNDHAERVARREEREGQQNARPGMSAAERISALRRRIADRGKALEDAEAHAATRCAQHGVVSRDADVHRRLRE
jgi:hypothetical protein